MMGVVGGGEEREPQRGRGRGASPSRDGGVRTGMRMRVSAAPIRIPGFSQGFRPAPSAVSHLAMWAGGRQARLV